MQIFTELIATTEYTALALGYFDGVHLGHKKVISSAVECKKESLTPAVFTFAKTPKGVLELSDFKEKCKHLEEIGVEILYVIDFDTVKDKTPDEFVENIVKNVFNAKKVFCGFNYHFGKNGSGNIETLKELCLKNNIETYVINPVLIGDKVVSSTEIRKMLLEGNVEKASEFLGYDFGLTNVAVVGNQIGTKLGTPTINQQVKEGIILPKFGVYASKVFLEGKEYAGVTNIGVKPTVEGKTPLWETWLPEFKGGELYGKVVDVRLKSFLRSERKFESLEELKEQILKDGKKALELIN